MRERALLATILIVTSAVLVCAQVERERTLVRGRQLLRLELMPGEQVISIGPSAFQPFRESLRYLCSGAELHPYPPSLPEGPLIFNAPPVSMYTAPLMLPHNSTVTRLVLYCFDNGAHSDVVLQLMHKTNSNTVVQSLLLLSSSGGVEEWREFRSSGIRSVPIDNLNGFYWLQLYFYGGNSPDVVLGHVKVYYREE